MIYNNTNSEQFKFHCIMWLSLISTAFFMLQAPLIIPTELSESHNRKRWRWSEKWKDEVVEINIRLWDIWISAKLMKTGLCQAVCCNNQSLFSKKIHPISTLTITQRTIKLYVYEQVENAELSSKTKVIVILYTQTTIMLCYLNFRYLST